MKYKNLIKREYSLEQLLECTDLAEHWDELEPAQRFLLVTVYDVKFERKDKSNEIH